LHLYWTQKFRVHKTQGNFNNGIGLPLTIFQIEKEHQVAVLEMGISEFGEMHELADNGAAGYYGYYQYRFMSSGEFENQRWNLKSKDRKLCPFETGWCCDIKWR